MWKWLLRLTLHWQFCQLSQVSFMLAHQTVLMVEPSDCIKRKQEVYQLASCSIFSWTPLPLWAESPLPLTEVSCLVFLASLSFFGLSSSGFLCAGIKQDRTRTYFFALNTDSLHATQAHMATSTTRHNVPSHNNEAQTPQKHQATNVF